MSIVVRPATLARFAATSPPCSGPRTRDSSVCWCLSHRLDSKTNRALVGRARGEYVKMLCGRKVAPGVLAYADAEVAGWAAVAPRSELPFARSAKIPHVDGLPVWSVWCIRVRPGYRGRGISHTLLEGAVAYARSRGAPGDGRLPRGQSGQEGQPDDGLRGYPQALRGTPTSPSHRHHLGLRRVPARLDAAGPSLTARRAHPRSHRTAQRHRHPAAHPQGVAAPGGGYWPRRP